ncbi:MAG: hypothetical protein ACR2IE_18550 [Candidatus Sumerlaeaceae bacterium]
MSLPIEFTDKERRYLRSISSKLRELFVLVFEAEPELLNEPVYASSGFTADLWLRNALSHSSQVMVDLQALLAPSDRVGSDDSPSSFVLRVRGKPGSPTVHLQFVELLLGTSEIPLAERFRLAAEFVPPPLGTLAADLLRIPGVVEVLNFYELYQLHDVPVTFDADAVNGAKEVLEKIGRLVYDPQHRFGANVQQGANEFWGPKSEFQEWEFAWPDLQVIARALLVPLANTCGFPAFEKFPGEEWPAGVEPPFEVPLLLALALTNHGFAGLYFQLTNSNVWSALKALQHRVNESDPDDAELLKLEVKLTRDAIEAAVVELRERGSAEDIALSPCVPMYTAGEAILYLALLTSQAAEFLGRNELEEVLKLAEEFPEHTDVWLHAISVYMEQPERSPQRMQKLAASLCAATIPPDRLDHWYSDALLDWLEDVEPSHGKQILRKMACFQVETFKTNRAERYSEKELQQLIECVETEAEVQLATYEKRLQLRDEAELQDLIESFEAKAEAQLITQRPGSSAEAEVILTELVDGLHEYGFEVSNLPEKSRGLIHNLEVARCAAPYLRSFAYIHWVETAVRRCIDNAIERSAELRGKYEADMRQAAEGANRRGHYGPASRGEAYRSFRSDVNFLLKHSPLLGTKMTYADRPRLETFSEIRNKVCHFQPYDVEDERELEQIAKQIVRRLPQDVRGILFS